MTNTRTADITTILFDAGNTLTFVDLSRVGRIFHEAKTPHPPEALARAERAARAVMYRTSEENPGIRDRDRWGIYMRALFDAIGLRDESTARRIHADLLEVHHRENLWRAVPPDTPSVLDELRQRGYRLGVVSNADGRVPALLSEIGPGGVLRGHHRLASRRGGKARGAHLRTGLGSAERGDAQHAMYVGDFPDVDVVGARRAGLAPVLLDPLGVARAMDCPVIRSLRELTTLLPAAAPR